ncbi:MAG: ABC transporter ATP-binding protein [Lachnospiraceae bacterium]|nr:ABC transporter ATP-binding protein [Lachnospiraceae bacterium]
MLKISNITKKYKKNIVLNKVSFNVASGECIGLLGENGTGKSTLLSILAGITKADEGKLDFSSDIKIGYVPQENPLITDLSVKDNLSLWYKKSLPAIVDKLGLTESLNKKVAHLSGGMKKRLSIAIAMADNPNLLLMDEPSAALDLSCKQMIRDYITEFCANGGSVIIATHDEMELDICNKLFVINSGNCRSIPTTLRGRELIKELARID